MEGKLSIRDRTTGASASKETIENKSKSLMGEKSSNNSPPEFLVRRNEIFQKRSVSVSGGDSPDSLVQAHGYSGSGPLKGNSDEQATTSLLFKGVHPSNRGKTAASASSHFGRQLSESRDNRKPASVSSGRNSTIAKEPVSLKTNADGVWSGAGDKAGNATASGNKSVTLPRYVNDRAGVQLSHSRGLGLSNLHHKMGEDCSADSATIKDISALETDKSMGLEKHFDTEKVYEKLAPAAKTNGATKIPNGVGGQGPRLIKDQTESEFSYGPGFVDKLKSRFISLSLNDKTKTVGSNLRRFSSLENVLDSDSESYTITNDVTKRKRPIGNAHNRMRFRGAPLQSKNSFKRAKSMETLLLEPEHQIKPTNSTGKGQRPISMIDTVSELNFINENVVIIEKKQPVMKSENLTTMLNSQELGSYGNKINKKRDVALNRQPSNISDEELPKPDTVKTYKLFFEPVGKRPTPNNNNARKLPSARPSAKNNLNNKTSNHSSVGSKNIAYTSSSHKPSLLAQPKPSAKENVIVNGNQLESQENSRVNSPAKEPSKIWNNLDADNSTEKSNFEEKDSEKAEISIDSHETKITNNGLSKVNNYGTSLTLNIVKGDVKPPIKKATTPTKIIKDESEIVSSNGAAAAATATINKIGAIPFVSSTIGKSDITSTIGVHRLLAEKTSLEKQEKPITFHKPESEMSSTQQLPPPTVKEVTTQNRMEISSRGLVSSPLAEFNGITSESVEKIAPKFNISNASLNALEATKKENEEDSLKPSALLGNKKSGLWQKNPQTQMTTTIVYNFVGKEVKSHLPTNPAPFGCKPAALPKKKARNSLEGKEGLSLKNGLDLGAVSGESNDYDDESDEELDELDIGANLPVASGISFVGENVPCPKSAILSRRNRNHNINFVEEEPLVYEYPSEDSVYDDLGSTAKHNNSSEPNHQTVIQNGTPSPEEDQNSSLANHVGMQLQGIRNAPSLGMGSTGALSSYTPSMLSSADSFQLGVSRSNYQQPDTSKVNSQDAKEDEPADLNETSSWSSATTSDLLF